MLVPAGFNRNPSFPLGYAKVPVTVPVVYDQYFPRFWPIFGKNGGFFFKNLYVDQNFAEI
jgi:hypothetical protein